MTVELPRDNVVRIDLMILIVADHATTGPVARYTIGPMPLGYRTKCQQAVQVACVPLISDSAMCITDPERFS